MTYEDGTTSTGTAVFSDWTLNAGGSKPVSQDTTVVSMPYRVTGSGGQDSVTTYVFATRIPVDPAKKIASVGLAAADDGTNHVFAVGFGG